MRGILIACALFHCISFAATPAKLKWVFLDLNNQPGEVAMAKKLTTGRAEVLVFKQARDFIKHLRENPDDRFSTIVISGESSGGHYGSADGFDISDLAELGKSYPSLSNVDAIYALGCNTAVALTAKRWLKSLPGLRYVAGFDGSAPRGAPIVDFLKTAENARSKLIAIEKLDDLKTAAKPHYRYGNIAINGAVAILNPKNEDVLFASRKGGAVSLKLKNATRDEAMCEEALTNLYGTVKTVSGNSTFKKNSLAELYAPFTTDPGAKEFDPECKALKPLPAVQDAEAPLRKAYASLQTLTGCEDAFFSDLDLSESYGFRNQADVEAELYSLISFIHADQFVANWGICAENYLSAISKKIERCFTPQSPESKLATRLGAIPLSRKTLCQLEQTLRRYAGPTQAGRNANDHQAGDLRSFMNASPHQLPSWDLWISLKEPKLKDFCSTLTVGKTTKDWLEKDVVPNEGNFVSFGKCSAELPKGEFEVALSWKKSKSSTTKDSPDPQPVQHQESR